MHVQHFGDVQCHVLRVSGFSLVCAGFIRNLSVCFRDGNVELSEMLTDLEGIRKYFKSENHVFHAATLQWWPPAIHQIPLLHGMHHHGFNLIPASSQFSLLVRPTQHVIECSVLPAWRYSIASAGVWKHIYREWIHSRKGKTSTGI